MLQFFYNMRLKRVVIVDLIAISAGFVLRVAAGTVIIQVAQFSPWLYVCTALLALFLVIGKRATGSATVAIGWSVRASCHARLQPGITR